MSVEVPPLDVTEIRADFPILNQKVHGKPLVYFDNASTSQRPQQVVRAIIDAYEQYYANVHRGIHWLSERSTDLFERTREKTRKFLGAAAKEEVIFTSGTTGAINLVARSWGDAFVAEGDEILVTEMEHHSNLVPWHQLAQRVGCKIRAIPITGQGLLDLDQVDTLLTPRTKLLAVTAISNVLGTINPIGELVKLAHNQGALVLVDAAQAVPHARIDVQHWDADFLAFSGHKMMGPSGVGVLYGKRHLLEAMPPFLGGGSMIRRVYVDHFEHADLPAKFEAGTPPIVAAIGLEPAIDYLEDLGMESITTHERMLCEQAHKVLSQIDAVRILGPEPAVKAGMVSFLVEGVHAHDVAQILDREGIAIRAGHHCAMPLHQRLGTSASCRASFYCYNTAAEVDKLADGLDAVLRVFRRSGSRKM